MEDLETPTPGRSRTGRLIATEVRGMIATMYRNELRSMIKWRDAWKKIGDSCEALAKCFTGIGAVLAFAASAIHDPKTSDIFSFSSGTVGTIGLVMLTYSSYAIRESKQRTGEVNGILGAIGVTPLPDIAEEDEDASRNNNN